MKLSVTLTFLDVAKVGLELLLFNTAHGTSLGKTASREYDAQAAREATDAKLTKKSSDADKEVELLKRQAASDVCLQRQTSELSRVNAQLV